MFMIIIVLTSCDISSTAYIGFTNLHHIQLVPITKDPEPLTPTLPAATEVLYHLQWYKLNHMTTT